VSKITYKNKKGKITITNKISYPEAIINERVYNAIASGVFANFLPVSIRQKKKETCIECVIQDLITLGQYLNGIVTKKMFLDVVQEIVLQIKNCEKSMVNANNMDLQSDRIFIDPKTKNVKFIFWPLVNNQRAEPPHLFLKQLPYELNFDPHEDNTYLDTYKAFFNTTNPFSINAFDKMISKLCKKKEEDPPDVPDEQEDQEKETPKDDGIEYIPPVADTNDGDEKPPVDRKRNHIHCPQCGEMNLLGANYCILCGKELREIVPTEQKKYDTKSFKTMEYGTHVLNNDSNGTTVLGHDEQAPPKYPKLIRVQTQETCYVDKPNFRIGTERAYCDLFISDNNFISRSHADIITKECRYYIVDRNSTNKTYVNGKVIPKEQKIEIFPGTQIRLANEEFVFDMES